MRMLFFHIHILLLQERMLFLLRLHKYFSPPDSDTEDEGYRSPLSATEAKEGSLISDHHEERRPYGRVLYDNSNKKRLFDQKEGFFTTLTVGLMRSSCN